MTVKLIDPSTAARLARQWADGQTIDVINAVINTNDTRTAAMLAVNVYSCLMAQHGSVMADRFKRALRRHT